MWLLPQALRIVFTYKISVYLR